MHVDASLQNVYSQGWGCDNAVKVVTGGLAQWGGRKTAFAAGSRWPAWSSAGPAAHTHPSDYMLLSINLSIVGSQCKIQFIIV